MGSAAAGDEPAAQVRARSTVANLMGQIVIGHGKARRSPRAAAVPCLAQSPNMSSLVEVVEDQQGAVVPKATVSLSKTATGVSREAVSGQGGAATLIALPLTGAYQVTVTKAGFGMPPPATSRCAPARRRRSA